MFEQAGALPRSKEVVVPASPFLHLNLLLLGVCLAALLGTEREKEAAVTDESELAVTVMAPCRVHETVLA